MELLWKQPLHHSYKGLSPKCTNCSDSVLCSPSSLGIRCHYSQKEACSLSEQAFMRFPLSPLGEIQIERREHKASPLAILDSYCFSFWLQHRPLTKSLLPALNPEKDRTGKWAVNKKCRLLRFFKVYTNYKIHLQHRCVRDKSLDVLCLLGSRSSLVLALDWACITLSGILAFKYKTPPKSFSAHFICRQNTCPESWRGERGISMVSWRGSAAHPSQGPASLTRLPVSLLCLPEQSTIDRLPKRWKLISRSHGAWRLSIRVPAELGSGGSARGPGTRPPPVSSCGVPSGRECAERDLPSLREAPVLWDSTLLTWLNLNEFLKGLSASTVTLGMLAAA